LEVKAPSVLERLLTAEAPRTPTQIQILGEPSAAVHVGGATLNGARQSGDAHREPTPASIGANPGADESSKIIHGRGIIPGRNP
jgi:hypothetical protein